VPDCSQINTSLSHLSAPHPGRCNRSAEGVASHNFSLVMLFCLCFLNYITDKENLEEAASFQEHKAKAFFIAERKIPYILKLSESLNYLGGTL